MSSTYTINVWKNSLSFNQHNMIYQWSIFSFFACAFKTRLYSYIQSAIRKKDPKHNYFDCNTRVQHRSVAAAAASVCIRRRGPRAINAPIHVDTTGWRRRCSLYAGQEGSIVVATVVAVIIITINSARRQNIYACLDTRRENKKVFARRRCVYTV